jgi:hypothetical protein
MMHAGQIKLVPSTIDFFVTLPLPEKKKALYIFCLPACLPARPAAT